MLVYMENFGHCCKLPVPDAASEVATQEPVCWLVPTLLPHLDESAPAPWRVQRDDNHLCVRFMHMDGEWEIPWRDSSRGGFLPDTLFFRLVARLVNRARTVSDAFRDMYSDRIIVRGEQQYLLQYHRAEHLLRLTVGGKDANAPAVVAQMMRHALMELQRSFGVKFRFEIECEWEDESAFWPLEYLPEDHEIGGLWAQRHSGTQHVGTLPQSVAPAVTTVSNVHILPPGKRWHFFICHHQGSGGDQANNLSILLERVGFRVWYDNSQNALHRNLKGMKAGVRQSECLLIFLSGRKETKGQPDANGKYEGLMTRWFCHEEMNTAHEEGLRCIGVMETDERHGQPNFEEEKKRARAGGTGGDLVHTSVQQNLKLLDAVCFIPLRRQAHEVPGMLAEIARQAQAQDCIRLTKSKQALGDPESEPQGVWDEEDARFSEPEPEPALLPEGVPSASSSLQDWNEEQFAAWLRDDMKLGDVADAAADEGVDGLTALEMEKDDWKLLGANGVKAAKIVAHIRTMASRGT
jgi:hypothetical protein